MQSEKGTCLPKKVAPAKVWAWCKGIVPKAQADRLLQALRHCLTHFAVAVQ